MLTVGFLITVWFTIRASQASGPSIAESALLVVLAALCQVGAAWAFGGEGKADPAHALRSSERLYELGFRAQQAGQLAETAYESNATRQELASTMGRLSVHLNFIEEGIVGGLKDWQAFHPDAMQLPPPSPPNEGSNDVE